MPQIFKPRANTLFRVGLLGAALAAFLLFALPDGLQRSPWWTWAGIARQQPVPFSHQHHVGALGLDCRYCHTTVERSSFAGLPPTATCMNCHSRIWSDSPMLEPVRDSFRTGRSLPWVRVNVLPDYVYFNHSIHVAKGVVCATCHGRLDEMPITRQDRPWLMSTCLECHKKSRVQGLTDCSTCHR